MDVTLLGTGGPAPDRRRHESCTLVSIGDERVLVDAGRGAVAQLARAGVEAGRVDPILLTHHHLDHIVELATLVRLSRFAPRPLRVLGPPDTETIVHQLLHGPFAKSFAADEAHDRWRRRTNASLPEVDAHDLTSGSVLDLGRWTLRAAEVEHGQTLLGIGDWWHCLAYRIEADGRSLVVSGDSTHSPGLVELARDADVLIQACIWAESEVQDEQDALEAASFFASAGIAGRIAADASVGKLVLTHIGRGARTDEMERDARRCYDGPIVVGEDLLAIRL